MHIMAFLFHFQVIKAYRVLVTQRCRLVTGASFYQKMQKAVLITQKCRLVTGLLSNINAGVKVLITQKCRLVKVK